MLGSSRKRSCFRLDRLAHRRAETGKDRHPPAASALPPNVGRGTPNAVLSLSRQSIGQRDRRARPAGQRDGVEGRSIFGFAQNRKKAGCPPHTPSAAAKCGARDTECRAVPLPAVHRPEGPASALSRTAGWGGRQIYFRFRADRGIPFAQVGVVRWAVCTTMRLRTAATHHPRCVGAAGKAQAHHYLRQGDSLIAQNRKKAGRPPHTRSAAAQCGARDTECRAVPLPAVHRPE